MSKRKPRRNPGSRDTKPRLREVGPDGPSAEAVGHIPLLEEILQSSAVSSARFEESLQSLLSMSSQIDPYFILPRLSFYGHLITYSDNVPDKKPDSLWQHHVELAQAMLLIFSRNETNVKISGQKSFTDYCDALTSTSESFQSRQWIDMFQAVPENESYQVQVHGKLRSFTQVVRNWSSGEEMAAIVSEAVMPLDDTFKSRCGIRASALPRMFYELNEATSKRVKTHFSRLRRAFRGGTANDLMTTFAEHFPGSYRTLENPAEFAAGMDDDLPLFRQKLSILSENEFLGMFTYSIEEFREFCGEAIESTALNDLLNMLTLNFGDLASVPPEFLLLDNPVWTKPFIAIGNDRWLCPCFATPQSFDFEIIEAFAKRHAMAERYFKARADYLEAATYSLFEKHFVGSSCFRNVTWNDQQDGTQYECDIVVIFHSYIILVEAKSRHIDSRTKRGAPDRLKRDVREIIEEPAVQSSRFRDFLLENRRIHHLNTSGGKAVSIDSTSVEHVVRISVSLDPLGDVLTRWPWLQQAGILRPDVEPAPCILFSSLKLVFEILRFPTAVLHYLVRRAEFEHRVNYLGDELDLIGLYLQNAFNINNIGIDEGILTLLGVSDGPVQRYLAEKTERRATLSLRPLNSLWRQLIAKLENERPPGWLPMIFVLRDFATKDQSIFEENLSFARAAVLDKKQDIDILPVITVTGPEKRRGGVLGVVYNGARLEDPQRVIENGIEEAFRGEDLMQLVVFSRDVNLPKSLYNSISFRGTPRH